MKSVIPSGTVYKHELKNIYVLRRKTNFQLFEKFLLKFLTPKSWGYLYQDH